MITPRNVPPARLRRRRRAARQRVLSSTRSMMKRMNSGSIRDVEFTFAQGEGYGLGVRVVVDPVAAGNLPSPGTFGWSGAASTHFIVDRDEELIALMMFQYQPRDMRPRDEFETLVYQAIID